MSISIFRIIPLLAFLPAFTAAGAVDSAAALMAAVRDGPEGASIEIAAGTYELEGPLDLKAGMTLKGAGMDKTILTCSANWKPSTTTLPDPEMKLEGLDTEAYLIRLKRDASGFSLSDMTLQGRHLHGAVFSWFSTDLHLHHLRIRETMWSGVRTFGMKKARIHDCEFIDAGGRWEKGQLGVKGGITGGGIFAVWMEDCEISHNRFTRTLTAPEREYYGIKVRQAKRCRLHHNTIGVNFSMEFPFENDEDNVIHHNICHGTISIPKHAGGPVPGSGKTFHIHHNWFKDSYSIEFVRNGVEIDHNLFDFDAAKDHGNLISGFGQAAAKGPALFHNNLVSNPGRGVIWINEVFNNLQILNNHIIARKTGTPRTEGLFGFNPRCDFSTIRFEHNLIECLDEPRPLFRNKESHSAILWNNLLKNVSDEDRLKNPPGKRPSGLKAPLKFTCGVHDEITVDGWKTSPSEKPAAQ